MADRIGKPVSQRQLRVGEMIKQSLSMIFIRNEAKVPNLETNTITVTEVRMSPDLKIAKAYVLPLGGKNAEESINILKEYYRRDFYKLDESKWRVCIADSDVILFAKGIANAKNLKVDIRFYSASACALASSIFDFNSFNSLSGFNTETLPDLAKSTRPNGLRNSNNSCVSDL